MSADEPRRPDQPPPHGPGEEPPSQHLEWRISALLDGELAAAEEVVARDHLAGCDACQQEFAEVMAARTMVRGLGEVEPPTGTIERSMARVQRRYQVRTGLFGLLAVAVVWIVLLILLAGLNPPTVEVPVGSFGERHAAAAAPPGSSPPGDVLDADAVADLRAPFVLPADLGDGWARIQALGHPDGSVQGLYRRAGGAPVSLFQQEGGLADDPPGGVRQVVAGREVWVGGDGAGHTVVVVPADDAVFTLVGGADVLEVVDDLPEPATYSLGDRVGLSVDNVLRRLGLD